MLAKRGIVACCGGSDRSRSGTGGASIALDNSFLTEAQSAENLAKEESLSGAHRRRGRESCEMVEAGEYSRGACCAIHTRRRITCPALYPDFRDAILRIYSNCRASGNLCAGI